MRTVAGRSRPEIIWTAGRPAESPCESIQFLGGSITYGRNADLLVGRQRGAALLAIAGYPISWIKDVFGVSSSTTHRDIGNACECIGVPNYPALLGGCLMRSVLNMQPGDPEALKRPFSLRDLGFLAEVSAGKDNGTIAAEQGKTKQAVANRLVRIGCRAGIPGDRASLVLAATLACGTVREGHGPNPLSEYSLAVVASEVLPAERQ